MTLFLLAHLCYCQAETPTVLIVCNSVDLPASEVLTSAFAAIGLKARVVSAGEVDMDGAEILIILGGPDAYEGVGAISSAVLNDSDEPWLREENGSLLIYLGLYEGVEAVVLAGHTRTETLFAARLFAKAGFAGSSLSAYAKTLQSRGIKAGQWTNYTVTILSQFGNSSGYMRYVVEEGSLGGEPALVLTQTVVNVYAPNSTMENRAYYLQNGSVCSVARIESPALSYETNLTCEPWSTLPENFTAEPRVLAKGVVEKRSVEAGEFLCAKFGTPYSVVWVSPEVPLTGIVELYEIQPDGSLIVMSLNGFSWG